MRGELDSATVVERLEANGGNVSETARQLDLSRRTIRRYRDRVIHDELPSEEKPIADIIAARKGEFARIRAARDARRLAKVAIDIAGPVGVLHMGDPHLDDPGTDLELIEQHLALVRETEGMLVGCAGDITNNWIGKLKRLYADQETTQSQAWQLAEWFFGSAPGQWLYMIGGNHDQWSGPSDPLHWIKRDCHVPLEYDGHRMELSFPSGHTVRLNARHNFKGVSQWNVAHGPSKAAQMGWRDNILICGHLHDTGYMPIIDPRPDTGIDGGIISHCLRLGSYKIFDAYAKTQGYSDQQLSPAVVTVIDPMARRETELVTVFLDVEHGVDYLRWRRK